MRSSGRPAARITPEQYQKALKAILETRWSDAKTPKDGNGLRRVVDKAIERYTAGAEATWPPRPEDLALFEHVLRGVRLSSSGEALRPTAPAPPPAAPQPPALPFLLNNA